MKGKYTNRIVHALANARREMLRSRIQHLVEWEPLSQPEEGCTAIIAVCSKLPDVLIANLRCLSSSRWPNLKRVILVFDCIRGSYRDESEQNIVNAFQELTIDFFYYAPRQY